MFWQSLQRASPNTYIRRHPYFHLFHHSAILTPRLLNHKLPPLPSRADLNPSTVTASPIYHPFRDSSTHLLPLLRNRDHSALRNHQQHPAMALSTGPMSKLPTPNVLYPQLLPRMAPSSSCMGQRPYRNILRVRSPRRMALSSSSRGHTRLSPKRIHSLRFNSNVFFFFISCLYSALRGRWWSFMRVYG